MHFYVPQNENMFSMASVKPTSLCKCSSKPHSGVGGKFLTIWHCTLRHLNTQGAQFCQNDPFDLCLLVSQEQPNLPSPSLLAGSLSTHTVVPVHSSGSDVMEPCIARLVEECCGFRTGWHPSAAFELRPSGPIVTGPARGNHESQKSADKHRRC